MRFAFERGNPADTRIASVARMQHGPVLQRAAEHARQTELAAMARMIGLEDIGNRIVRGMKTNPRCTRRFDAGHFVTQCLEQTPHAIVMFGGPHQRGHEQAFRQIAREIGKHLVARRLHVGK